MRRVGASFIAMTAGWLVMTLVGVPMVAISLGGAFNEILGAVMLYGFFSSFVVGGAWLLVYLPVYALIPTRSAFWKWGICVPAGFVTGALVPLVFFIVTNAGLWSASESSVAAMFIGLAAIVGGVAAAVGRWLFPWSRNYELQWPRRDGEKEGGPRD